MNASLDEIVIFIRAETGTRKNISENTVIEKDLRCTGDDFFDFIENYSKRFNVNTESFLWYFHSPEETFFNLGALFFKPPDRRVNRIPVTVGMLKQFADRGFWDVAYPPHTLPRRRYDIYLTWLIWLELLVIAVISALVK